MTVISVAPVDKRRCRVLLEEGLALVLYKGEIKKYGIEEGGELSEESCQEIIQDVLCKRARNRVIHLLKRSDQTEAQIRRKLQEGGYPAEAIKYAVDFVKNRHYIDDRTYAERYAECCSDRKSRKQMAYDLCQKGIDKEIVSLVLAETPIDEEEQIRKLLKKRGFSFSGDLPEEGEGEEERENIRKKRKEYEKNAAFLARKGFSWEAIQRVMNEKREP